MFRVSYNPTGLIEIYHKFFETVVDAYKFIIHGDFTADWWTLYEFTEEKHEDTSFRLILVDQSRN